MSQNKKYANILINTSNYDGKHSYVYKFPVAMNLQNARIAVDSMAIYNSTYNISSSLQNNQFVIKWLGTDYNIVIPDGYYSFDNLNNFLEHQCLINNLYCTTDSGSKFVYFMNISANSVSYKAELDLFTIPTSAQATSLSYTIASGATWSFPVSATTPQIQLNAGLQKLFGFKSQLLFPLTPQSSNQIFVSDTYPILSPIFCYIFTCNLINTKFSQSPNLFYQIPIKSDFGGLIDIQQRSAFIDVAEGSYNNITIQLLDQNLNPLQLNDPELSLTISLEY